MRGKPQQEMESPPQIVDMDGNPIKDLVEYNQEEGWYKVNKRDENGEFVEKDGKRVTVRVFDGFSVASPGTEESEKASTKDEELKEEQHEEVLDEDEK